MVSRPTQVVTPALAVFDTNVVVSAVVFRRGSRLAWLRDGWRQKQCIPLLSTPTATELLAVLAHPKFRLTTADRDELLAEYLPYCEVVELAERADHLPECRDPADRPFLELAVAGRAQFLVTGDQDLLVLGIVPGFEIVTPEAFGARVG